MGVNEVSERMIDAYNALSGGPLITKSTVGPDQPARSVNWNEAARFVNWLNTSKGYSRAYKITTGGASDNITLWTNLDAGYDAANPFRNANAFYYLPSEDEWYKAAYYDPNKSGGAGYWDYATGSDTPPTPVAGGTASGTAVYGAQTGPADITNAGGLSPYGTMAQNGNVSEFLESGFDAPNDSATESRAVRGGGWDNQSDILISSCRGFVSPPSHHFSAYLNLGFRVAAVPEPSAFLLTCIGTLGLALRRKRG
jgi:formylglycine-generating enzyme required for sulfatase activity